MAEDYSVDGKQTVVCGVNQNWDKIALCMKEGALPKNESGIAKDGTLLQRNDAIGVLVSIESFEKIAKENGISLLLLKMRLFSEFLA